MNRLASRFALFSLVLGTSAAAAPAVVTVEGKPPGSLTGKTVIIDPGHGLYFHETYGWTYQRSPIYGLHEDLHTNEIVMDYLRGHLEGAGARVLSTRALHRQPTSVIIDNTDSGYSEIGVWTTTTNVGLGYKGSYRYAALSRDRPTASAHWKTMLPSRGDYPVWVFYYAGADRSQAARFTISHAGGTTRVLVDQQRDRSRWVYLGTYPFVPAEPAEVTLDNLDLGAKGGGTVVIADAVRFGAGMGDYLHDGKTSEKPRWYEETYYYLLDHGAPESVYKTRTTERDSGLVARGLYADWQGGDAFVSIHTNAAEMPDVGSGVSSYIHSTAPSMGSAELQTAIHGELVRTNRSLYVPTFKDRGKLSANFAVVRETKTMPAVLLELAFHDTAKPDAELLRSQSYRSDISRAIYKGLARYFDTKAVIAPLSPTLLEAVNLEAGSVRIRWQPESDPLEPKAQPDFYRLYTMHVKEYGLTGFGDPIEVRGTQYTVTGLVPGEFVFFELRAANTGGESLPSSAIGVRVGEPGAKMQRLDDKLDEVPAASAEASGCRMASAASAPAGAASFLSLALGCLFLGSWLRRRKRF